MKLKIEERKGGSLNKLRHDERIPAVLYVKGGANEVISISKADFLAALRAIQKGFLPTTVFELEKDGKSVKAIVKDIQYHKTTYNILHLDFQQLYDDVKINVNVPLEFTGVADCVGIKLGGFLRKVMRTVRVNCLPKDMPKSFSLDIAKLGIKQSKRVRDLSVNAGVRVLAGDENVLAVIAK